MSDAPSFLITRILGISSSLFLSGFAFSASYYTSPAISLAPVSLRLQQWQVVYDLGKLVSPPVSALSAVLWSYSAWQVKNNSSSDWKSFAVAGVATLGNIIWTVGIMSPTNSQLLKTAKAAREDSLSAADEKDAVAALKRWDAMNYMRAGMPMVGAWIGLWAALK